MSKKKEKITVHISAEEQDVYGHKFIKDVGYLFYQNPNKHKKIETEFITVTKSSRLDHVYIDNKIIRSTFVITIKELERLLKKVKNQDKKFKKGGYFVHYNPELSFLIWKK